MATLHIPRASSLPDEPPAAPGGLEFKTATHPTGEVVDVDEHQGVVTAVVSVTGVVDEVDDNITSGAYTDTLTKRRPKVIWGHDWKSPIARVEQIAELPPGDRRLPTEINGGESWPAGAGALVTTMRFNLKSHAGREAFEAVRFFSETGEAQWSIGYGVPSGKARRDKNGVRHIKAIDLYEISFVLFGAAPQTTTLSLKDATAQLHQPAAGGGEEPEPEDPQDPVGLHQAAEADIDWDDVAAAAHHAPSTPGDPGDGGGKVLVRPPWVKASDQPWSNFDQSDYTLEQWHRACLVHQHQGEPTAKSQCKLPVRQPDGTVNRNGVHAAAAALAGARGGVDATDEEKRSAARQLRRLYSQLDEDPPESLQTGKTGSSVEIKASNTPWSNFDQSDYTLEQWHRACLVHQHQGGEPSSKDQCGLPVREPDGTVNRNGVHAAASRIGQVQTSDEEKRRAARKLARLYGQLDEDPPESLRRLAGQEGKAGVPGVADTPSDRASVRRLQRWYERGEGAAQIRWGQPGDFMRCVRIAGKHMTPDNAKGFCANRHKGALGVWPGQEHNKQTPGGGETEGEDEDSGHAEPAVASGVMVALYPPRQVAEQIAADGGTPAEHLHVTLAYLGDTSDVDATPEQIASAVRAAAADTTPLEGSVGGIATFPDQGDGAPVWVPVDVPGLEVLRETLVAELADAGIPVAADHGFTPHMSLGYDLPMPEPVARTPVVFDAVIVAAGPDRITVSLTPGSKYDPRLEHGPDAGHRAPDETKHAGEPQLPGSYEERMEAVRGAVEDLLAGEPDSDNQRAWDHVDVVGTWPDRVVATRMRFASRDSESYEIPYTAADGGVELGPPEPVRISISVDPARQQRSAGDGAEEIPVEDLLPLLGLVERSATAGRAVMLDSKAGRVLSAGNEQRLVRAVRQLLDVLRAAGVDPTGPDPGPAGGSDDGEGKQQAGGLVLHPDDYLRGLDLYLDQTPTQ